MESKKVIAIFGGTGKTGLPLLRQALLEGYSVRALLRNPDKLPEELRGNRDLEVFSGDALSQEKVEETTRGAEAILTVLGHTSGSPEDLLQRSTNYMIQAARNQNIKRIIFLSGSACSISTDGNSTKGRNFAVGLMKLFAKKVLNDSQQVCNGFSTCNDLDWTLVRPPRIKIGPVTGTYKTAEYQSLGLSASITHDDVAHFILQCLKNHSFVHQAPNCWN